jgi:tight adherence protein B
MIIVIAALAAAAAALWVRPRSLTPSQLAGRRRPAWPTWAGRRKPDRGAAAATCRVLAAELRAGSSPAEALQAAAGWTTGVLSEHLARCAALASMGSDPTRHLNRPPAGYPMLAALGGCWQVAAVSGSALATVLDRLAESIDEQARAADDLAAELAGPRASAVVLALLPVAGLALGSLIGVRPLDFLLGSPVGVLCLAGGSALDIAGVVWTRRLARNAGRVG